MQHCKQKYIHLRIETFFHFSNMSQIVSETMHAIEEGLLKKLKCTIMFQYSVCYILFRIMDAGLISGISVGNL